MWILFFILIGYLAWAVYSLYKLEGFDEIGRSIIEYIPEKPDRRAVAGLWSVIVVALVSSYFLFLQ